MHTHLLALLLFFDLAQEFVITIQIAPAQPQRSQIYCHRAQDHPIRGK